MTLTTAVGTVHILKLELLHVDDLNEFICCLILIVIGKSIVYALFRLSLFIGYILNSFIYLSCLYSLPQVKLFFIHSFVSKNAYKSCINRD